MGMHALKGGSIQTAVDTCRVLQLAMCAPSLQVQLWDNRATSNNASSFPGRWPASPSQGRERATCLRELQVVCVQKTACTSFIHLQD